MKNILKNKILIIFSIFIIFLSFFASNVFAGEFVFNGETYETSAEFDEYIGSKNYIVILKSSSLSYLIYAFDDKPSFYYKSHDYYPEYVGTLPANSSFSNYGWCSSLDKLFLTSSHVNNYCYETSYDVCHISAYDKPSGTIVVYSNFDIYCEDKLVFQGAPRPVEQVTIPEITQVAEIPQVITQVMKIMIPIGLIIFGIGLVIYLIRLVTSRVT